MQVFHYDGRAVDGYAIANVLAVVPALDLERSDREARTHTTAPGSAAERRAKKLCRGASIKLVPTVA